MILHCFFLLRWFGVVIIEKNYQGRENMEGFSYEIVKNPRIFKMNTLPAHLILWLAMSRNLYCPNNGREREYLSLFRAWKVPLLSGSMESLSDTVKTALRRQNLNSHRQYKRKTNWLFRCLSGVLRVG